MKTPLICHICHICICLCIPNSKYLKQKLDHLRKNLMIHSYINIQGLNKIMETPVIYHTYIDLHIHTYIYIRGIPITLSNPYIYIY